MERQVTLAAHVLAARRILTHQSFIQHMADFDPLPWRTKYRLENGNVDEDSDDEEVEEDAPVSTDLISPKRALQRQSSIVQSDKDKLRDHIDKVIETNVSPSEMVKRVIGRKDFKIEDIENVLDIMNTHIAADNERDQAFLQQKKHLVAFLQRKLHGYKEQAFHDRIFTPTCNFIVMNPSMSQRISAFMLHSRRNPQDLRRCADEIRDVMAQLQEMRGAFLKETWVDQVDEWQELCLLQKGLSSERAMMVLRCIFEDKEVMRTLGMACQMKSIRGTPPDGLMLRLKDCLGSHLKKNFFNYKRALDDELNNIEFIENQKNWIVAMRGSAIVALLIGFSNFLSSVLLNKMCNSFESSYCPPN